MLKFMNEIIIKTVGEGTPDDPKSIHIFQPDPMDDDRSGAVIISPDQVDILVQWLQEAKKEIENN